MASSDRKFDPPNFDQDSIRNLALAFDYVQTELREHGKLVLMEDVLAKRIVELAENGERDSEKLCDLSEHGINRAEKLEVPKDSQPTPEGDDQT